MSTHSPIPPSIGRIVLVRSVDPWFLDEPAQDAPAIITRVWTNDRIGVSIFRDGQTPVPLQTVSYDDVLPSDLLGVAAQFSRPVLMSWHWMDYQLQVAAERNAITGEVVPPPAPPQVPSQ